MRNKRKKGKMMSLVMAFGMSLSVLGGVATNSLQVKAGVNVSNPRIAEDGTVTWDKITFGNYYKDAEFMPEPIKWRILDIDSEGNAFLLADEALDCKPYNEEVKKTDSDEYTFMDDSHIWETCTLRDWLNGTDSYVGDDTAFIKAAFTVEERNSIIDTTVVNQVPSYNPKGVYNTTDKIYLLSIAEAMDASYGFAGTINEVNKTRRTKATDYAYINSPYRSTCTDYIGSYYSWLRSPGSSPLGECAYVINNGGGNMGTTLSNGLNTVRPVLHVNLSSPYVKDAGSVTSEGIETLGTNITKDVSDYDKPSVDTEGVTTWNCVYFGNYKQSASFDKKPIEWRVLSVSGNDAFVVADQVLDCKLYNDQVVEKTDSDEETYTDCSCTWETCTLRDWLNGTNTYTGDNTAFINTAFTDEERNAIIETNVVNDDNPSYNTEGGNNTTDKIYLLSIGEASNTSYGFDGTFDEESKTRQARGTDYAYINGAYRITDTIYAGNCYWWLRSPGDNNRNAMDVNDGGRGDDHGNNISRGDYAVRPALHVNISSSSVKAAGTVSSESSVTDDEVEAQEKADEVITLISTIGTVTKDRKTAIDSARSAYDALSELTKSKVTNYNVLQAAESKYEELTKSGSSNGDANETIGGKVDKPSDGATGSNTNTTPTTNEVPATTETVSTTPATTETLNDNLTTFNIKNKKTYKKSQKIKIKDEDGIKSVVLNTKKIKVKKGKKSVSFKLSSYKKSLKKKNKWNKIIVTDVNGNKKTIQFKVK